MKKVKAMFLFLIVMLGSTVSAGPAPYLLTVNSRADSVGGLIVYRANQYTVRAAFVDGSTPSTIAAGEVPFLHWYTNINSSATISPASYAVVSGVTGQVDFTFSPAAINYAPGLYGYQIGIKTSGDNYRVFRNGLFTIRGSPGAVGADPITWVTNMNIALISAVGQWPTSNLPMSTLDARYIGADPTNAPTIAEWQSSNATLQANINLKTPTSRTITINGVTRTLASNATFTVTSGTGDHAALSNLSWTASGHTSTPARLAGFFEGGAAGLAGFGAGMYLDGDDNIAVSNGIIAGAAAGATAVQPATLAGYVPTNRTVTINGVTKSLNSNATFTVAGGTGAVSSVNGQTGDVVLDAGDVGAYPVTGGTLAGTMTATNVNVVGILKFTEGSGAGEVRDYADGTSWNPYERKFYTGVGGPAFDYYTSTINFYSNNLSNIGTLAATAITVGGAGVLTTNATRQSVTLAPGGSAGQFLSRDGTTNKWVTQSYYADFAGPVTQSVYNVQAFGWRDYERTLVRFVGKTQLSTVTVDIIESATNAWGYTTNGSFVLSTNGVNSTTFGDGTIAASRWAGWKFRQRGAACTNVAWTLKWTGAQ